MTDLQTKPDAPRQHVTPDAIMQLGLGFWGSKTLLSAVELGLFTELAGTKLDAEALCARLGLHTRGLPRELRRAPGRAGLDGRGPHVAPAVT